MSYFSDWNKEIEKVSSTGESNQFVQDYYRLEQQAYDKVLSNYPEKFSGKFSELMDKLAFENKPLIFAGFLEGVNESLKKSLDLDSLTDDSEVDLDIDFEKLLYNMHDAKASWLFNLESWNNVLPKEKREEIAKKFRTDHIAISTKVGRNDPCPCGSGKKYKQCCAKKETL